MENDGEKCRKMRERGERKIDRDGVEIERGGERWREVEGAGERYAERWRETGREDFYITLDDTTSYYHIT